MIALSHLRTNRLSPERNLVGVDYLPGVHKFHCPGFLVNEDVIGMGRLCRKRRMVQSSNKNYERNEQNLWKFWRSQVQKAARPPAS
jgi:hypothetical protein